MNPSLQTLLELIAGDEFDEDDSWIEISEVQWIRTDVAINLSVRLSYEKSQAWSVRCRDVRESRIINHGASALAVLDDHPLLWPHRQIKEVLHFRGQPHNVNATIGRLLAAHWSVVDRWFEFDRFLRPEIMQLLSAGDGKLAEGPQALIQAYAEVLRGDNVDSSTLSCGGPKRWLDGHWVEECGPLQLLLLDQTFFICSDVQAART